MDKIHYLHWTRYTFFAGQVSHGKRVAARPYCPVSWDAGVASHDNTRHALPMGSVSVGSGEASGAVKADRSGVLGVTWVAMNPRRVRGMQREGHVVAGPMDGAIGEVAPSLSTHVGWCA